VYIVKNNTSHDLSVPELSLTLGPGNKIDLDMITSRHYIDQSRTLRNLLSTNKMICIVRDDGTGAYQIKRVHVQEPRPQSPSSSDVMESIKQLEDKITKRIDEKVASSQSQIDVNALNNAISALQALTGGSGKISHIAEQKIEEAKSEIDPKRLVDIQKRTVGRLVNNAESNVKHDEQITDKDVAKNARELEGLL